MPKIKVQTSSGIVIVNARNLQSVDGIHFRVNSGVLEYSTDGITWKKA